MQSGNEAESMRTYDRFVDYEVDVDDSELAPLTLRDISNDGFEPLLFQAE